MLGSNVRRNRLGIPKHRSGSVFQDSRDKMCKCHERERSIGLWAQDRPVQGWTGQRRERGGKRRRGISLFELNGWNCVSVSEAGQDADGLRFYTRFVPQLLSLIAFWLRDLL